MISNIWLIKTSVGVDGGLLTDTTTTFTYLTATISKIVLILICFGFSFMFTMRATPPSLLLQSQLTVNTSLLIPIISGVSMPPCPKWVSFNDIMSEFLKMLSPLISSIFLLKFPIFKCSNLTPPGILWNRFDPICGKMFFLGLFISFSTWSDTWIWLHV